jgi:hypothetical protein
MATLKISNTSELRDFLLGKMQEVAAGKIEASTCKAISNLSQQVYNTLNIEIKFAQMKEKISDKSLGALSFDGKR